MIKAKLLTIRFIVPVFGRLNFQKSDEITKL